MSESDWWKKGVFYQIYPRSFMDKNGDGVGDIAGITDRLNYIADLGVDAIWISPCFESPMKDFGYDVSDYRKIDPLFGTNEDFDVLLQKTHHLGLKVIIDMVLSHTSIEHPWFKESRLAKNNRKADWYIWADPKPDGSPPNNWQSIFGGPAWTFETKRGQYYMHNYFKEQPDLNFHNENVQKQTLSECQYWLERGIDGFRLDSINTWFQDKGLRDNPAHPKDIFSSGTQLDFPTPYSMQKHVYDKSQPETIRFLEKLRALMDQHPNTMLLGEIADEHPFKLAAEYTDGEKLLHTSYNLHLITGTDEDNITPDTIKAPFKELKRQPGDGWPSWAFSNHDSVRVATRWGKGIKDKERFAILLNKLLLSLRGTPFLYQGEELGLPQATIPFEKIQDPWGKALWPEWQGRDGSRTPMPWKHNEVHAGFSTEHPDTETWLPMPNEHIIRSVNKQEKSSNSVLNETREFIAWRKTQPLLQAGEIEFKDNAGESLIIFDRFDDNDCMTCVFNITEQRIEYDSKTYEPLSASFMNNGQSEMKFGS